MATNEVKTHKYKGFEITNDTCIRVNGKRVWAIKDRLAPHSFHTLAEAKEYINGNWGSKGSAKHSYFVFTKNIDLYKKLQKDIEKSAKALLLSVLANRDRINLWNIAYDTANFIATYYDNDGYPHNFYISSIFVEKNEIKFEGDLDSDIETIPLSELGNESQLAEIVDYLLTHFPNLFVKFA